MMRPRTPITAGWLAQDNAYLTSIHTEVLRYPAPKPRCCQDFDTEAEHLYPVQWADVHGSTRVLYEYISIAHVRRDWNMQDLLTGGDYRDSEIPYEDA